MSQRSGNCIRYGSVYDKKPQRYAEDSRTECNRFAAVHSGTTTASFERSRTSCLRSASTRTCDHMKNCTQLELGITVGPDVSYVDINVTFEQKR